MLRGNRGRAQSGTRLLRTSPLSRTGTAEGPRINSRGTELSPCGRARRAPKRIERGPLSLAPWLEGVGCRIVDHCREPASGRLQPDRAARIHSARTVLGWVRKRAPAPNTVAAGRASARISGTQYGLSSTAYRQPRCGARCPCPSAASPAALDPTATAAWWASRRPSPP